MEEISTSIILQALSLLALAYFVVGFIAIILTALVSKALKFDIFWDWDGYKMEWVRNGIEIKIIALWPFCFVLLLINIFNKAITGIMTLLIDKPKRSFPDKWA
jgi:hypothetical protein